MAIDPVVLPPSENVFDKATVAFAHASCKAANFESGQPRSRVAFKAQEYGSVLIRRRRGI